MRCQGSTSWHAVVQGLALVHLEPALPSTARLATASHPVALPLRASSRQLHTTRRRGQAAAAAAAVTSARRSDETVSEDPPSASFHPEPSSPPSSKSKQRPKKAAATASEPPTTADAENTGPKSKEPPKLRESEADRDHQAWRRSGEPSNPLRKNLASSSPSTIPPPESKKPKPLWLSQKEALRKKFPEGWRPRKRLSPDALVGIRALNAQFPEVYTTEALASKFEVPAEAIRRILKSRWTPDAEQEAERQERWTRRGQSVWARKAELGIKPPRRWREMGIARDPGWHAGRARGLERERAWEEEEKRKYREYLDGKAGGREEGEGTET